MLNIIYKLFYPLDRMSRYVFPRKTHGVKGVVRHEDKILLVRHTYGNTEAWMLPGGKVESGEALEAALHREIREEVGLSLTKTEFLCKFPAPGLPGDTVHCFVAHASSDMVAPDGMEIAEAVWFSHDKLPENIPSHTKLVLSLFKDLSSPGV